MIERVMLLDAVLDDREFTWLGSPRSRRLQSQTFSVFVMTAVKPIARSTWMSACCLGC